MSISPTSDQVRKNSTSHPSSSGEEEDESPTKSTRKSSVHKKPISDDNGNIVTPLRTTRVTRSKGAPPSGKTPGHVTPKKSEREKQKKEVHVEDEISEGSEDEEEDTKVEKSCDKSDENVDESPDMKIDGTENIPKDNDSSDKEKADRDSNVDDHITETKNATSDNEAEQLIIDETLNKEAELKVVSSDKETDTVSDKGDVSDQLAVEDKDREMKEEKMEEKENSGDNDFQCDSNLDIDVEIEDKHSENNESEKDDDEIMELDEEEEEGQLCIDEASDEGETKKEVNSREESTLSKGFNNSLKDRTCEFCAVVKKSPADLQRHIRKHTGERPFKCKMCSRMFKAKRSLQYHQFMHHGIKSENSNISQKYSLMRKRKLEMDQLRAELISPDGTKRFKGDDSPDVTMMDGMIRQDGKDSSTSPESGADVECQSDRTCYVCGKLCLKPSDLKRHMMCHTGERPFKCDICGKPFRAKNSMLYHKKSAHGFDIELSPGLEERFLRLKKQSNLHSLATKMAHQNIEITPKPSISNGSEVDMEDSDETSSIPNLDSYTMDKGNKIFYSCGYTSSFQDGEVELDESTGLFKHKVSKGSQGVLADSDMLANSKNMLENSDSMDAPDITQMIKDGSSMVGAEIIHGSHFTKNRISIRNETVLITRLDGVNLSTGKDMCLYKCYLCGKVFNYLSKVQCHLSMHFEKDIVIFQCQLCKASFWFKNQVMQHIRKRHPSEVDNASKRQAMECKNNDADNDTSNSDMDSGIQVKSEGNDENSDEREGSSSPVEGKPDKDDIFKKDSEDHENEMLCRFWRGLKYRKNSNGSYVCLVCRKSFHREISLLKHIKIHSGHKQCYCQECGKGFSEFTALRQHLALFHGLRDSHHTLKPHIKASTKHSLLSNLLSKKTGPKSDTEVDDTSRQSQEERARELLIKEGIQEDVTVVMPCGPDDDTEVDGGPRLLDVWSERDSEESSEANSQDGIVTPVLPRRSLAKEMNKSKRKSFQPVKLHNASIPPPAPLQVSIPAPATSAARVPIQIPSRLLINGEAARAAVATLPGRIELPGGVQIKQEPLSPKADVPSTSISTTSNLVNTNPQVAQFVMNPGQMILTSGSGSTSGQPQPMMLLSNSAFPSPIPGNIIGMVQVTNSANQISGKDSVPSDSSTPMSSDPSPANTEGSDRDTLVGFPRVQWSPNETPPTSVSGFTWSQISADGRKVTSLSRTHSRLPIVNAPVNRDKVCKPMTLTDGRQVYRCPFCSKDFLSYSDINRHMDFHEDIRPYKCKYCDYFARTNSQLKVHMMRHQGIREFCCKVCNYKGVTQSDLNRHMKSQIHILKSRNECNHCGEGFVTQKNLEKHLDGNCIVKVTKLEDTSDFC